MGLLSGKKILIVGIANNQSIAYGCAKAMHEAGASLAITYLNEKAKPHVEPIATEFGAELFMPLDVTNPTQQQALFAQIKEYWGSLDGVLHSIAFAPKEDLHGRVIDSSPAGFAQAMDISCHSFMRLAHDAEPLMSEGGCLLTMSYYGGERVIRNYNMMGPVKAALEMSAKYMAAELGQQKIRVNTLSTGPVRTRAASGLAHFDALMQEAANRAPLHQLVEIEQIGHMAAFLMSDHAKHVTAQTIYVDAGYNSIG